MSLTEWQQLLHDHFAKLHEQRTLGGTSLPIFALEHGLTSDQIQFLKQDIWSHIAHRPPSRQHYLPWIVYAAEIGYEYRGYEYWQTFGESTPGWQKFGDRYWLRQRFINFFTTYGGAKPTGRWAEHFSIICWPIYHSILPKDLQCQLAHTLFRARHYFTKESIESPLVLGRLIRSHALNASSRFRDLAEDPLLVGQIGLALLLQSHQSTTGLILPETLERIRKDLESQYEAQFLLKSATSLAWRIRFSGTSSTTANRPPAAPIAGPPREERPSASLRPFLLIYPDGPTEWLVRIELPNFTHLLSRFPNAREHLAACRCMIGGSGGQRLATGRILYPNQKVSLVKWPTPGEPLIRYDNIPEDFRMLIQTESILQRGPIWLFNIGIDGVGRQLERLCVRPGNEYFILSEAKIPEFRTWITNARIQCEGINGYYLRLPTEMTPGFSEYLKTLGIETIGTLSVWPVGSAPANWDNGEQVEWLVTDSPCIGIKADFLASQIEIKLEGDSTEEVRVIPTDPKEIIFVELPELGVGRHKLIVTALHSRGVSRGELDVLIRAPRDWSSAEDPQRPLVVFADPKIPATEDVWEGKASIEIYCTEFAEISCTVTLLDRSGENVLASRHHSLPDLPLYEEGWNKFFAEHFRSAQEMQNKYDLAHYLRIFVDAKDLGTYSLVTERQFSSLRWCVSRHQGGYGLTLIDDTGEERSPTISQASFSNPNVFSDLPVFEDSYRGQIVIESCQEGGLYRAQQGDFRSGIVIPPVPDASLGLNQLRNLFVEPRVVIPEQTVGSFRTILQSLEDWYECQLPGDIASGANRVKVISTLTQNLTIALCGSEWVKTELQCINSDDPKFLYELGDRISDIHRERPVGRELLTISINIIELSPQERLSKLHQIVESYQWFANEDSHGNRYSRNSMWLCEFALRLASDPVMLARWAGLDLDEGLDRIIRQPALMRAARFMVATLQTANLSSNIIASAASTKWNW